MKKLLTYIVCITLLVVVFFNFNKITTFLINKISSTNKLVIKPSNEYEKDYDFSFVQESKDFIPYSKQDLINIIYTIANKGWTEFTFYCPNEYKKCIEDIDNITDDSILLSNISSFLHPFNYFTDVDAIIHLSGEITIKTKYLYTEQQIETINELSDKLIKNTITEDDTDYEKIKKLHDKIINDTKYDVERNKKKTSPYLSYIAYGPLVDGYATCNGYTDLMAILLTKLGYKNFKVTTSNFILEDEQTGHIWNAVYINNEWVHLDLTWDDPVSKDGKDYLYHTYFLIDSEELKKADTGNVKMEEHIFDLSIYAELKSD